ncbi:carbohydrate esterase family 8 protein [Cylindrobasidium torrendii FP15055 ss-10]|uniref:pectinesterase n=1 Tax=Cylindrobasidium torrendii FP15055 ss-10 TaxID=1314674 RepID=A0A0D7BI10_9AGAR|nr:carbohydrate esterase family 8 protein [Cylindrobasidium torrendii FP15055 ss-10]
MALSRPLCWAYLVTVLSSWTALGDALPYDRAACQAPSANPLEGCPEGTLLVAADGTSANFTSIQDAILSLGDNGSTTATILVLPGTYSEQVNITRPGPLTLLGQTGAPNNASANTVTVIFEGLNVTEAGDNAHSSVLTVSPTLEASLTGMGPSGYPVPEDTPFGNEDFRAYNIDFVNDFSDYAVMPELAVSVSYANAGFYFCGFYSYQDTVYIGKLGNAYFYNSTIAGEVDFLYGFGTAWIQSSELLLRSCGGGITAWKGTNTTFDNKYGVYIHDSRVVKANSSLQIEGECPLGRPWNAQHRSIFANNYLDDSVAPSGYIAWGSTDPRTNNYTFMAEYNDYGPGFDLDARLAENLTKILTEEEYKEYSTVEVVFQEAFSGKFGYVGWIDTSPEA